jgi:hypothetical protein
LLELQCRILRGEEDEDDKEAVEVVEAEESTTATSMGEAAADGSSQHKKIRRQKQGVLVVDRVVVTLPP